MDINNFGPFSSEVCKQTTNIENERFRLEVQPEFDLKISTKVIEQIDDYVEVRLIFNIELLKAECRELTIDYSTIGSNITIDWISPPLNRMLTLGAHRLIYVTLQTKKNVFDSMGCGLFTTLKFSDVIGNNYQQSIITSYTYTEQTLDIVPPIRDLETD